MLTATLLTHHPTLIPTLTITVCVAVVHFTHQDNPKSERPCTRRDTTDLTQTMASSNPDDNEVPPQMAQARWWKIGDDPKETPSQTPYTETLEDVRKHK
jgi:hypothetical protein